MIRRETATRSSSDGPRVAALAVVLGLVVLVIGISLHGTEITIAVISGLVVLVVTLVGAFSAKAKLKRELDSPPGSPP